MTRAQRGFTLVELMMVVAIIGVITAVLFSVNARPYTANAEVTADQISSTLAYARTRAVSTRRVHKVHLYSVSGEQVLRLQVAPATGMAYDASTSDDWPLVEDKRIPHSAIIWAAVAAVANAGATPTQATTLDYSIFFRPDGSVSSASTIYITDRSATPKKSRVVVYKVTGSTYARQTW